jgi:hypothetical protein
MLSNEPATFRQSGFRMPLLSRLRLWPVSERPGGWLPLPPGPLLAIGGAPGSVVLCRAATCRVAPYLQLQHADEKGPDPMSVKMRKGLFPVDLTSGGKGLYGDKRGLYGTG